MERTVIRRIPAPLSIWLLIQITIVIVSFKTIVIDANEHKHQNDDVSSIITIEPNRFLRESSCHYSNGLNNHDPHGEQSQSQPQVGLSCHKYKITALNSNPKQCLQINHRNQRKQEEESKKSNIICVDQDYPQKDWTDGTNGCLAYNNNPSWCQLYGDIRPGENQQSAKEVCCVCGGGTNMTWRFQVGDVVYDDTSPWRSSSSSVCPLQVISNPKKRRRIDYSVFPFMFQSVEDCFMDDMVMTNNPARGYIRRFREAGTQQTTYLDGDIANLQPYFDIELKKCRNGVLEQEFWVIPTTTTTTSTTKDSTTLSGSDNDHQEKQSVIIKHVLTNTTIYYRPSNQLTKKKSVSQEVQLERVFTDQHRKFDGSDKYIYIQTLEKDTISSVQSLVSGSFGETDYSKPKWMALDYESPYSMWSLERVLFESSNSTTTTNINATPTVYDEHGLWLKNKVSKGGNAGLDYLKQLTPWHLLDVERDASKQEVKLRFRELSRQFHPDKQKHRGDGTKNDDIENKISPQLLEQVFILLQQAYDGLKTSNTQQKNNYQQQSEVEAQLFAHSHAVIELLPSHWTLFPSNKTSTTGLERKQSYILSTNDIVSNTFAEDMSMTCLPSNKTLCQNKNRNKTEYEEVGQQTDSVRAWLLFMYSPRCSMSRTVVSMVELAANHLKSHGIHVGAYACGIYGESLEQSKRKGHIAWQEDPICKQFQRIETPNTHFLIEPIISENSDPTFVEKAAKFVNYYAAAAHGTIIDLFPRKLIDFAIDSKRSWDDSFLVEYLTRDDLENPAFHQVNRIITYIDDISVNNKNHDVQQTFLTELPRVARRLIEANITVNAVFCASEADGDSSTMIDCSKHSVSFLPDIKIFAINQTRGVSLINHQLEDRRDAQIAIEVMVNSLAGILGLGDDQDYLDYEDDVNEEETINNGDNACPNAMNPANDEEFEKLGGLDGMNELPDSADEPILLAEKKGATRLENSSRPKLATKPQSRTLKERTPERQLGSGKIIGGGSSQGGTRRIAG